MQLQIARQKCITYGMSESGNFKVPLTDVVLLNIMFQTSLIVHESIDVCLTLEFADQFLDLQDQRHVRPSQNTD